MFAPFQKKKSSLEPQPSRELLTLRRDLEPQQEDPSHPAWSDPGEEPGAPDGKSHMDKRSLDLLFAVEQMIKAKQQVEMSRNDLEDRLGHASGQNDRLNRDIKNLGKVIEEREKSILELERGLSDKNLKVDQMMEDYRELQAGLSGEIEELKSVIELERRNYAGLLQKHNEAAAERNKKISELDEKNARLEAELSQMRQKFEAVRQEKAHLLQVVNDFTHRMSSPFLSASQEGSSD